MLVEFSVANFKSIKDEARLSLVAGPGKEHHETNVAMSKGVRPIPLLRSAAIYGANAAGKTNLLQALQVMQRMVTRPTGDLGELPVTPSVSTRIVKPGRRRSR